MKYNKSIVHFGEAGKTPLGNMWVAVSENGLVAIHFGKNLREFEGYLKRRLKCAIEYRPRYVEDAITQIYEYLSGKRQVFELQVDWTIFSEFKHLVLRTTSAIPYSETRTYGEIAIQIGGPRAARAVGRAEATNPLPLVIPCHRVIGADRKLRGYGIGEGIKTKEWLLKMEGAVLT